MTACSCAICVRPTLAAKPAPISSGPLSEYAKRKPAAVAGRADVSSLEAEALKALAL